MESAVTRRTAVLGDIREEFAGFRRSHQGGKGRGYPQALRDLAVSAMRQGSSPREVSEAAGVTCESLRNWRKSSPGREPRVADEQSARPVELTLLESRESRPPFAAISVSPEKDVLRVLPEPLARIRFASGTRMTLPVSALSERLISLLNRGASS